jgi:hypothetical protein
LQETIDRTRRMRIYFRSLADDFLGTRNFGRELRREKRFRTRDFKPWRLNTNEERKKSTC